MAATESLPTYPSSIGLLLHDLQKLGLPMRELRANCTLTLSQDFVEQIRDLNDSEDDFKTFADLLLNETPEKRDEAFKVWSEIALINNNKVASKPQLPRHSSFSPESVPEERHSTVAVSGTSNDDDLTTSQFDCNVCPALAKAISPTSESTELLLPIVQRFSSVEPSAQNNNAVTVSSNEMIVPGDNPPTIVPVKETYRPEPVAVFRNNDVSYQYDESKELLSHGDIEKNPGPGVKAVPVEEKSGMKCVHCGYLLKNPVQTEDGVRLCKDCCSEIQRKPGPCSDCGVAIDEETSAFPDRAVARELARLPVYCVYKGLGCDWVGPLKEWEDHCAQCYYKGVECPHDGCKEIIEKGKLEEHKLTCLYRHQDCKYYGVNMVFAKMKQHLAESCKEYPVSCDAQAEGCNVELPRKQLREHKLKYCIIEECLICHKKVYRKTGKEVPDRSHRVAVAGDVIISNSSKPLLNDPSSKADQSEHSCVVPTVVISDSPTLASRKKRSRGRVVADGDNENKPSQSKATFKSNSPHLSAKSQRSTRVDNDGDAFDAYIESNQRVGDAHVIIPKKPIVATGGLNKPKSCGRVVADGDERFQPRLSSPIRRARLVTSETDGTSKSSGETSESGLASKTSKGSGITEDGGEPHSESSSDDLPVHLSVPLDNFRRHQTAALRPGVQELEGQVVAMAADVNQCTQDISDGHVLIQNLQGEIAALKEAHDKQQSYIASLETELKQVKEEVQVIARKPTVDKNQLSKVSELEKLVSERDQYITRQKRDLDEVKKQLSSLKTKSDSNAALLQELQLKSRVTPPTRRPTTAAADVQYGNVISETRFIQLEHRVEDLARETSTTRAHLQELEIQLQAQVAATYNGSCLWRIPDVAKRRRDALEDRILSIYSPAFYTGRHGYKMCCRMYLNGDGMGLGMNISVFFVVMRGDYDALLKWPFEHKVSLILVDQTHRKHIVQTFKPTPDSSSFKRPTSDINVVSGCPQFASIDVLQDDRFVQDVTMYIKCIVDTSKIFHP